MLIIKSKLSSVFIGNHILLKTLKNISKTASQLFVICDNNVYQYLSKFQNFSKIIFNKKFTEKDKSFKNVIELLQLFIKHNVTKNDYIVIIGGGALLDTAAFACSIYKRGIPFITIPTTFLSIIDAAIGGKNGINFKGIKNIIGTINQPQYIIIDTFFLDKNSILNGVGELIKYAMIGGYVLYKFIFNNSNALMNYNKNILFKVIYKCAKFKLKIVEKDPNDNNARHILNFGHTIGHFIESISNYKISHSDAIIVGMKVELLCGNKYGLIKDGFLQRFYNLLHAFKPKQIINIPNFTYQQFKNIVSQDKKNECKTYLTLSIPTSFGKNKLFFNVPIKNVYKYFLQSIYENG